jgi:hypothetical protein
MPWSVMYNPELHIIEIVYTGIITLDDIKEEIDASMALGKKEDTNKFLTDARDIDLKASVFDMHSIPRLFAAKNAERLGKEAVLLPESPEAQDAIYFYETVCKNAGWRIKVFSEREEAIDWLISRSNVSIKENEGDISNSE